MRASRFNVASPIAGTADTFLFNTLTDSQVVVSADVIDVLARLDRGELPEEDEETQQAVAALRELGFVVESRDAEERALAAFFANIRDDRTHLRVTLLTTLQCNFACDYCVQGDDPSHHGASGRMSLDTAARVGDWMESRLDEVRPERFTLTFFGGEPLLNMPVVEYLAARMWEACRTRGVRSGVSLITNGLLLTEAVVDRLLPFGLNGVKITLDGDRTTHDRLRPLRGGQGTFDRILANMAAVAPKVRLSVGGNFDVESAASYPALLDLLRAQPWADRIAKVTFKPIIRGPNTGRPLSPAAAGRTLIPLTPVAASGAPLGGTCMTVAGHGGQASPCDSCGLVDERMGWLRAETRAHGFETLDGVHLGPCELHRRHAYTVGPEGSLYACPGFSGERELATGHVDATRDAAHAAARSRFASHAPWTQCTDCALVPVCGGGCSVAAHHEQGDLSAPSCHRDAMIAAIDEMAVQHAPQA